jgi:ABC-2 type transport system ATP-binding protein
VLHIERLSKIYPPAEGALKFFMKTASDKPVEALTEVSLEVGRGQIVGVVGPNGAGKTTLFRIIATLLEPTSGTVLMDGRDITSDPDWVRNRLGLVLEGERGVYQRLTGLQNLEFFGAMQGMGSVDARRRGSELMERLGLSHRDRRVFGYSAGMRVRLALARSLLADPQLLLLDEPTRSLDPKASVEAMELVAGLAESGRAVLFASHRLDEIRSFCDEVIVIRDGQVRYAGPPTGSDLVALMSEEERRS